MLTSRAVLAALLVCGACHHEKKAPTVPLAEPAPAATAQVKQAVPVSNNLRAGDALVRQCSLHFANSQEAPKFSFDQAELTMQDRNVLEQIADCVTKGPLKGKKLQLVGRADPRGTEEYNLGLGDRRANNVSTYLERLGVSAAVLHTTTRGALDASGHDDASWQQDRRVDVDLMN